MGNYASTRWSISHRKREIVERCLKLSVSDFVRAYGKEASERRHIVGTIHGGDWQIAFAMYLKEGHLVLRLNYSFTVGREKHKRSPLIEISDTACNYGGRRYWFNCPCCTRRVVHLYMVNGEFACRHCHNLTYASVQPEPKFFDPVQRLRSLEAKLKNRTS